MLVFVDESGYPHPNDPTEMPVLLAVIMPEREMETVTRLVFQLKEKHDFRKEIHAKAILTPSTYRRALPGTAAEAIVRFNEAFFDIVAMFHIAIFAIVMPRPRNVPNTPPGHLPRHHQRLLQAVDAFSFQSNRRDKAIVVYDAGLMQLLAMTTSGGEGSEAKSS